MRKDVITAIIIFILIIAAGTGLMYVSAQTTSNPTLSPTPTQQQSNTSTSTSNVKKLEITDEKVGTGPAAKKGDTVTVNYVGTLENGKQFDSSYSRNQPFTFTIGAGQVIKGWELGVVGMKVGGKRKLVIPPDLGYGSTAQGSIPANSTLIFEIELLSIK